MNWNECLSDISSEKVTFRRRGHKNLMILLESDHALKLLTPDQTRMIGMEDVLMGANEIVAKEALLMQKKECREGGSATRDNHKVMLRQLIGKVLDVSKERQLLIPVNLLFDTLKRVFSSLYLRENFGGQYYISIINLILTLRSYWGEMKSRKWKELIRLSTVVYDDNILNLEKPKVAKTIAYLISLGCAHSNLELWLPSKIEFFEIAVKDSATKLSHHQECVMLMTVSFSRAIAKENHRMLCQFGEKVIEAVLSMYDHTVTEELLMKNLILEFLEIQVKVHHPCGALVGALESYADDWGEWINHLETLYFKITKEVDYLNRKSHGRHKELKMLPRFTEVAVQVFYLVSKIYEEGNSIECNNYEINPKRQKKELGLPLIIQNLKENVKEDAVWPWLKIISDTVNQYDDLIIPKIYTDFIDLMSELLESSRNNFVITYSFKCCSALAKHTRLDIVPDQVYKRAWQKIWTVTLRTMALNLYEEAAHEMTCTYLNELQEITAFDELLDLYLKKTILLSLPSVKTLYFLLTKSPVINHMQDSEQEILVRWLFQDSEKPGSAHKIHEVEYLVRVLFSLCSEKNIPVNRSLQSGKVVWKLEEYFQKINFGADLLIPKVKADSTKNICQEICSLKDVFTLVKDMLCEGSDNLLSEANRLLKEERISERGFDTAEYISYQILLILRISSQLLDFGLISLEHPHIIRLLNYFEKLMKSLTELLINLFFDYSGVRMNQTLKNMKDFYDIQQSKSLLEYIKEKTPSSSINLLFNIMKKREAKFEGQFEDRKPYVEFMKSNLEPYIPGKMDSFTDYYQITDYQVLRESDVIKVLACQVLGSFCCCKGDSEILPIQNQIHNHLLTNVLKEHQSNYTLYLQMFLGFFNESIRKGAMKLKYLDSALYELNRIMGLFPNDVEIFQVLLGILADVMKVSYGGESPYTIVVKNFQDCILKLHENDAEENWPPSVLVKYVDVVAELTKLDYAYRHQSVQLGDLQNMKNCDHLLQELDSHYSAVRFAVAHHIWPLFFELRDAREEHLPMLTTWMKFIIGSCPDVTDSQGEKYQSNILCTIHCLIAVAVSTPYLRKLALFHILKILTKYNVSKEMGCRIFKLMGKNMNIEDPRRLVTEYLTYFLEKWIFHSKLQEFPFWLVWNSLEEFYSQNEGVIFSILFILNHEDLNTICELVNKNIPEMLKAYPGTVLSFTLKKAFEDPHKPSEHLNAVSYIISELCKSNPECTLYQILAFKENSILYNMFKLYFDDEEMKRLCQNHLLNHDQLKICRTESSPFCYDNDVLLRSLSHIQKYSKESKEFLHYLIDKAPSHLRAVTLWLAKDAICAISPSDSFVALLSFQSFVERVGKLLISAKKEKKFSHLDEIAFGLIRDVCFSYIRLIKKTWGNKDPVVQEVSFLFLKNFVLSFGVELIQSLKIILMPFIGALIDLLEGGVVKTFEKEIIEFMETIMEMKSLEECLKDLAPFPNTELFQKLATVQKGLQQGKKKTDLNEEIRSFMRSYTTYGCCRYESLLHLQNVLKMCKEQLKDLYEDLEKKKRYYNDYGSDPLHQLVCMITKFSTSSDQKISNEAAKCLSELGSCELKTTVLVREMVSSVEDPHDEMKRNGLHKLSFKCFELIPRYLRDYDIEVVLVATTALESILSSKEGKLTLSTLKRKNWPPQFALAKDFTVEDTYVTLELSMSPLVFNEESFNETLKKWIPTDTCSHSEWIVSLVLSLLGCFNENSSYLKSLLTICSHKVELCEEIFPFILEVLWMNTDVETHAALYERIRNFFSASYKAIINTHQSLSNEIIPMKNKKSIITMLDAINFLNLQHPGIHKDTGKPANDEKLAIDYVCCAVIAQHCSSFFTAIQYCALWINANSENTESNTLHYHINAGTPHVNEILQVLRESYAGIGDTDALYGCGIGHLFEPQGRIQHFKHLDKWEQVMRSYELEVAYCGQPENLDGLLKAIQMLGMDELLMRFVDSKEMQQYDGLKYECAWRLGAWNLLPTMRKDRKQLSLAELKDSSSGVEIVTKINERKLNELFHQHLFLAINYIKSGKYKESLDFLDVARRFVIDSLALASLEACQNIYRPLARLQAIRDAEIFVNAFLSKKKRVLPYIIEDWKKSDDVGHQSFNLIEPVNAVRLILLQYCCPDAGRSSDGTLDLNAAKTKAMVDIRLQQSRIAREANMYWVAEKYLRAIRQIPNVVTNLNFRLKLELEEAKLFWSKGDKDVGKIVLEKLIASIHPKDHYLEYTHALMTYGCWVMETHSERGKAPLLKYFGKTIEHMIDNEHEKHSEDFINALKALAVFADENFIETGKQVESSSFKQQKETACASKHIASHYQKTRASRDELKFAQMMQMQAKVDETEIKNIENEKASFHSLALLNYINVLKYSYDKDLDIIYRLVSLMLEPIRDRRKVEEEIQWIPTFKFIPVIRQLIPRVITKDGCAEFFKKLIEKCALDHPHHILPPLFSVAYSTRDATNIQGSHAFITEGQKENTSAAQVILRELKRKIQLKDNILQLQRLWEALINLAYFNDFNAIKRTSYPIPRDHPLMKLKHLDCVQIPTIELKGSLVPTYKNIVSVHKYEAEFHLVGGINKPKKITCIGSNGVHYTQLLKGTDDPRQDAVMVQVIELINELMVKDRQTRKRNLIMRTYKVVPLTLRSGLIEWCGNTIAIAEYLLQNSKKYRPNDYDIKDCRKMMEAVDLKPHKLKLQNYTEICEHLKPFFGRYFLSKYQNPCIWYEMTNVYARSVATSSIIGYILGLGDRHLQNILLDTVTSEVIHIDLGIAFEQGRLLKCPETVPFRLTRNIVDGMGVSGVEGVFKKCSEEVMRVIRQHHKSILTVLEVLIYDPLYAWTLKPLPQALKEQHDAVLSISEDDLEGSSKESPAFFNSFGKPLKTFPESKLDEDERNPFAVRALQKIEHKILGVEDGYPPSSIESQIDKLIKIAQDPENLCCLFSGWQAYL